MSPFLHQCADGKVEYFSVPALMRLLQGGVAPEALVDFSRFDTADANLFMRLSMIFHICGNAAMALESQRDALKRSILYRLPAATPAPALRLLAILKPGYMKDNTPLEFLLDGGDVELQMLYVGDGLAPPASLPEHDLVFVSIAHSASHLALLETVRLLLGQSNRPVLNLPPPGFTLERDAVSALLEAIPGLMLPRTRALARAALADARDFPLIARPCGSQAGEGLERIEHAAQWAGYLARHPDAMFYVAPFVDYRGADGLYRKWRIALIDGAPHICHLAIADHWIVHYHGAGMKQHAARREEEDRAMQTGAFCLRHGAALRAVATRLALDYVVIDCAETADGRLLFFEADNIALVHAMDPPDLFGYKQAPMRAVFAVFRAMLARRAAV
jgi:hypothetical protein